ncbi:MAG TPA: PGPGW domain-containing protein [Solirubrobacteraceae bacterium]|nr:PGPGW domain-containing protein [Solirubrobacteraceae bacterium]
MATADPPNADAGAEPKAALRKPVFVMRLEAQRERHRRRPFYVRVAYILVGFTLLLGGVGMLLLPGPAFVVIPIGLAILSLEFSWAEGLLDRALEQGEIARRRAAATTKTQRILTAITGVLAAAAFTACAILYDIPLLPV